MEKQIAKPGVACRFLGRDAVVEKEWVKNSFNSKIFDLEIRMEKTGRAVKVTSGDLSLEGIYTPQELLSIEMTKGDQCRSCTVRGNFKLCSDTPCNIHNSWRNQELQNKIKVLESEQPIREVYEALGWQGGTIWQVIDEIKRLKEAERYLNDINENRKEGI